MIAAEMKGYHISCDVIRQGMRQSIDVVAHLRRSRQ